MPALNYHARFAPKVEAAIKRQTIRLPRIDGRDPRAGQTLYHFTGQRTKACRRLGTSVCEGVAGVYIRQDFYLLDRCEPVRKPALLDRFAQADGFDAWPDLTDWFLKGGRQWFFGYLIEWETFTPATKEPGE